MADEATRAKGVPDGLPVGWIAPEGAILDDGDLQEMRDALRVGKHVTIASDGHVYVSGQPTGKPMTPEAETFIEAKLGVVKEMVMMGGGMSIHPDGHMAGAFASQHIKVSLGPDRQLDADELNLIRSGIMSGATIAVLPDGSVQTVLKPGTPAPTGARAKEIMDFFDKEVSSGRFIKTLEDGNVVRLTGDQYEEFPLPNVKTAPGMDFPEQGGPLTPPPPAEPPKPETVDVDLLGDPAEMTQLSDQLDARAAQLRNEMAKHLGQETTRLGTERDAAARREWSAQREIEAAKIQVNRENKVVADERKVIDRLESEARALEAKGNTTLAEEKREEARVHLSREAAAGDRSRAADEARKQLEVEAKAQGEKVKSLESQLAANNDAVKQGEVALDAMEKRADLLDVAAAKLGESKRLEAQAKELRAKGDTAGADKLQQQADGIAAQGFGAQADADKITIDTAALGTAVGQPVTQPGAADTGTRPVTLPPPIFDDDAVGTAPRRLVSIPASGEEDPTGAAAIAAAAAQPTEDTIDQDALASATPGTDTLGSEKTGTDTTSADATGADTAGAETTADAEPTAVAAADSSSGDPALSDPIPDVDVATQVAAIDASTDALSTDPDAGFDDPLFAADDTAGAPADDNMATDDFDLA
jgi:hypothetical protein